jgi:hypothetical protein
MACRCREVGRRGREAGIRSQGGQGGREIMQGGREAGRAERREAGRQGSEEGSCREARNRYQGGDEAARRRGDKLKGARGQGACLPEEGKGFCDRFSLATARGCLFLLSLFCSSYRQFVSHANT